MATQPTIEIASLKSDPYVPQFQETLDPTDETLKLRGGAKGHGVYDEIRRDPHAHAVLQKRKLEITAREWKINPASESRLDKKAAAEVERQLRALNFDRLTGGMLGAVLKGFAVAECVWANVGGMWTVVRMPVKKQRRFRFTIDGELRLLTRDNQMQGVPVPDRKFVVHRYSVDDDEDDPYGVGLGSVLFWPAWFKRQVLAHWLKGAEKNAGPTKHATYQGGYDKATSDKLVSDLSSSVNDSVIVTPENVELALLEARNGGGADVFEKLGRYLDELTSEAVLGETLTTNSGERGARSLGEVHNEVRLAIAKADSDLLSQTLKETVIRWIVELNFPGAGIPELWRDFEEAEDLNTKIDRDVKIFGLGYEPEDPDYISETYGDSWVKKAQPEEKTAPAGPPGKGKGKSGKAALDALFADKPQGELSASDQVAETLTDQLEPLAAPAIDKMIDAVREEVMAAASFDDLAERLARLSRELDVDDLAGLMEQAITLAELQGVASAKEEA